MEEKKGPVWGDTENKIRYILERIFDPEWVGKKVEITVDSTGALPMKGRRFVKIFTHPRLGAVKEEELDKIVEEWRKAVEPYLLYTNHIHYKTATVRGGSKLYLLYDRWLEG